MRYTLTFLEEQYAHLIDHLFEGHTRPERAAFLICGLSTADNETRLLVRWVCLVADQELASQSAGHLTVLAKSFLPIMKQADQEGACFVFVHSHPKGVPEHSRQDDNLYLVRRAGIDRRVVFACPSRCGRRIDLNLMSSQEPYWTVSSEKSAISIEPSVWLRDDPCQSHFFVRRNKVIWV